MWGLGKVFGGIHKAVKKVGGGATRHVGGAIGKVGRSVHLPGANKGIFKKREASSEDESSGEAKKSGGFKSAFSKVKERAGGEARMSESSSKEEAAPAKMDKSESVQKETVKPQASLASRMKSETGNQMKSWQKPGQKKKIAVKNVFNKMTKAS